MRTWRARLLACLLPVIVAGGCGGDSTNAGGNTPGAGGTPTSPTPPASSGPPARVLVVTHTTGFRHSSIDVAERVIPQLGRSTGLFETSFCRTADDVRQMLTPTGLAGVDAVVFANTTGNLGIPDLRAFLDWIAANHGFAAMHSASDTYHDAPAYLDMLGNEFETHGDQTEVDAVVEAAGHPAVAHVAPRYRVSTKSIDSPTTIAPPSRRS